MNENSVVISVPEEIKIENGVPAETQDLSGHDLNLTDTTSKILNAVGNAVGDAAQLLVGDGYGAAVGGGLDNDQDTPY